MKKKSILQSEEDRIELKTRTSSVSTEDKIVKLLKELKSQKEIKDECQCSQPYVSLIGTKKGIYSRRKVTELLQSGKTPEDIASEGNVNLDAVVKLREQLKETKKEKTKTKNETLVSDQIISMASNLISPKEIANTIYTEESYVYFVMKKEGIYSKRKVTELLQSGKTPEEITQEGNVNLDAVIKLREELEGEKKSTETSKSAKIVELAKDLIEDSEIAKKVKSTNAYVRYIRSKEKIYGKRKVKKMLLDGKTPEDIALEGNVNLSAVIKLEEHLKEKKREETKNETLVSDQIISMASNLISPKEIANAIYSEESYVYFVMKKEGIYSRRQVIKLIKNGKTPEDIALEGNVNLYAVVKLRKELEGEKKSAETSKSTKIVELAKDLIEDSEIAKKVKSTNAYVRYIRSKEKIYGKRKVKKMLLDGKTPEDIALEGNINLYAVVKLREELEKSKELYGPHQQDTTSTTGDVRVIRGQNKDGRVPGQYSNKASIATQTIPKNTRENDKINITILQMARQVKSIDKIVSTLGIPEYTIRNLLRKNNILPREDIIFLINQGEKTPQEIAQESGCDLHEIEKLYYRIAELTKRIEQDPKRKRALELLQKGMSESQIATTIRLSKESILEMKELIVGTVEKPISEERKQADFKIDILNLRTSINSIQQPSKTHAATTDYKIQKILYKYPELLGIKEYTLFAYAYAKAGSYLQAIDIGEEYLGLDTPSISALKTRIEEILQEEKKKKEGQYVGDFTEDGYPGR